MWHSGERRVMRTEFWWVKLKEIEELQDLSADGRMMLRCTFT